MKKLIYRIAFLTVITFGAVACGEENEIVPSGQTLETGDENGNENCGPGGCS